MGKIGKISPIKRQYSKDQGQTLATSLAEKGMTMFPNTIKGMVPYKEKNGDYRTGLDPEALYIKRMGNDEAEIERARVTSMRTELEDLTGLDLGPKSNYYTKMFDSHFNDEERAQYVKLEDKPNIFNLSVAQQAITFAWLRVHPDIAPTYNSWERGQSSYRCPLIANCRFFVDDEDFEQEVQYKKNMLIDKAINSIFTMSPTRQLKIAKLLSLPVSYNSKPEAVYNALTSFIKDPNPRNKRGSNVTDFNSVSSMADENLEMRFRIKEALDFNVYRTGKGGKIYEGETLMGEDENDLIEYFTNSKNQEDYLALQKKIDNAKSVEI